MIISSLKRIKHKLRIWLISWPQKTECNICKWRGRHFLSDGWHKDTVCPQCGSQVRHRLLVAAWNNIPIVQFDKLVGGKTVIHFAPEPIIARIVSAKAQNYRTADLFREGVDLKLDLCEMRGINDSSVDLVIACDVLEHVPNDERALRELHRILRSGGCVILTVPQKDGLRTTY